MKTLLWFLLLCLPGSLWAQSGELWASGGASILGGAGLGSASSDGSTNDVHLGSGFRFGFRFACNSAGHFGHEIQYAYNRTDFTDSAGAILSNAGSEGTAIHQAGYNLLYHFRPTKEGSKVRPFVTAGFHVNDYVLPPSATPQGSSVKPGFNVGAGVKMRISPMFAVRFDVRQYETGKPNWGGILSNQGSLLHQTEVSGGFGIYF